MSISAAELRRLKSIEQAYHSYSSIPSPSVSWPVVPVPARNPVLAPGFAAPVPIVGEEALEEGRAVAAEVSAHQSGNSPSELTISLSFLISWLLLLAQLVGAWMAMTGGLALGLEKPFTTQLLPSLLVSLALLLLGNDLHATLGL